MKCKILLGIVLIHFFSPRISMGEEKFVVEPKFSSIRCSVKYVVVPRINADIKDFSGIIAFDPKKVDKSSVVLKIKTASIDTKKPSWNRFIRSRRLLDASKYPEIVFQSQSVKYKKGQYFVKGILNMHGVSREIIFPFTIEGPVSNKNGQRLIRAKGEWLINRKDFNVIWHKTWDKGGMIIGDIVKIDWDLVGFKK